MVRCVDARFYIKKLFEKKIFQGPKGNNAMVLFTAQNMPFS
jgi:hypothetical protein